MRHAFRIYPLLAIWLFCLLCSNVFAAAEYTVPEPQYYYHYLPNDDQWDWLGDCAVAWDTLVGDNTGNYDDNDYLFGYYVDSYDQPILDHLPSSENGYFEMAVLDSTQLETQGYATWEEKPGNGITYYWWNSSQEIIEADVFVNADIASNEDQFYRTLTHEFGHALGLPHDERYLNIMYAGTWRQPPNHASSWYTRMMDMKYMRDSLETVNNDYGETVWVFEQWPDVAVWSQTHEDSGTNGDLIMTDVSPRAVAAGDDITFEHLHVENRGNLTALDVRVTFYLSTNDNITDQDYPIGWFEWEEMDPEARWSNGSYTLTVPGDIPTGDYYVGAVATSSSDERSGANNRTIFTGDYYSQFEPIVITLTGDNATDTPLATSTDTPYDTATSTPTITARVTATHTPSDSVIDPTSTPTGTISPGDNPGDFDLSGYVNYQDLWTLIEEWRTDDGDFSNLPANIDPDMNGDDSIDAHDIIMLMNYWHERYSSQSIPTDTPTATTTPSNTPTQSLAATDYYIAVTGSDSSGDGTKSAPWKTIQHAVHWVTTNALPSESAPAAFRISDGTYEENILLSDYISLYGGYNDSSWTRNIEDNKTYIDGDGQGSCIKCGDRELDETGVQDCRLDGLYLVNGMGDGTINKSGPREMGGALFCYNSTVIIEDCCFLKNKAPERGGGIYMTYSSATINSCVFSDNESLEDDGGAIFTYDGDFLHISNSSFHGNKTGDDGGGVYSADIEISMEDCTFSSNYAEEDGGGARCYSEGAITLNNCSFTDNYSGHYGGGVQLENQNGVDVSGCLISGNSARTGGGIFVEAFGTISSCTVSDNTARDSHGGGIFIDNNSGETVDVSSCSIFGNSTDQSGGGIYIKGENPTIVNCSIYENFAYFSGGGIECHYTCEPKIINCKIYNNGLGTTSFGAAGAGIHTTSASPLIAGCLIYDNTSEGSLECAGIFCEYDTSLPTVVNCTIFNNKNTDFNRGNGITMESEAVPTVVNSILWGNGLDIYPRYSETSPVVSYCCIETTGDANEGTGVIHENPNFVDSDNDDFHLQTGSPSRDAGSNNAVPAELTTDLDGNQRISSTVDMGVYE